MADKIKIWLARNLALVFSILRWVKPNLVIKGQALITSFDDVQEVLSRNDVFHVPYAAKMEKVTNGSNFFLGMQQTPTYTRDVSNMRLAVRRDDIPERIVPFVETTSDSILAKQPGSIDIVHELTRVVPTQLIGEYFGTPGWDQNEFTDAATKLFAYLFYPDDPELESAALETAVTVREYLDQTIADRKRQRGGHDDVLERCLVMQDAQLPGMTDLDIRNNLLGLLVGAIPTTSKASTDVIDYLLDHPELLADAQTAAQANDDDMMYRYVMETLRLRPFAAGIQRICSEDYVVAKGTLRRAKIPKGTTVLAATQSAMMDHRKIKQAKTFRLDRPDYYYMHFGYSLHSCFGQYINAVQIPGIVKSVLKRPGLKRAAGDAGIMTTWGPGPFPTHLTLEFDA